MDTVYSDYDFNPAKGFDLEYYNVFFSAVNRLFVRVFKYHCITLNMWFPLLIPTPENLILKLHTV